MAININVSRCVRVYFLDTASDEFPGTVILIVAKRICHIAMYINGTGKVAFVR